MENERVFLDIEVPGVEIKRLLKLRGISLKKLAEDKGLSYFFLAKFLLQITYETHEGKKIRYVAVHVRKALAEALQISFNELWSEQGKKTLQDLIDKEIEKKIEKKVTFLKECHKPSPENLSHKFNLKRFIKNLISLGRYEIYWGAREK